MRYPFAHRTKRIVFLFVLLPTATLAYITLPRGDVRLPAENVRARTQDITIAANSPVVQRGRFLDVPPAYVSQSGAVRTPADEAAIEELALTAAATPLDATTHAPTQYAPNVSSSGGVVETPARGAERSRHSSGGSTPYPLMLARGMAAAASGVSGTAKPAATAGSATTETTATADAAPVTATTTALTTSAGSISTATSTAATTTATTTATSAANTRTDAPPGPAAPPAVAAGGQNAIANTENTPAGPTVAQVFSGPAAQGVSGNPGQGNGNSPTSQSPSPTPEPLTLLLTAGGVACMYGARRYIL